MDNIIRTIDSLSNQTPNCITGGSTTETCVDTPSCLAFNTVQSVDMESLPLPWLPADVLVLVFQMVLDMTDHDFSTQNRSRGTPPSVTLSHVCTTWRNVALSSPLLWTRITGSPPWKLDMMRLYLDRSDPCPLDFRLTATRRMLDGMGNLNAVDEVCCQTPEIYGMLEGHVARCRRISIEVQDNFQPILNAFLNYFQDLPIPLPLLQELYLGEYSQDTEERPIQQRLETVDIFLKGVPALTSAKIGIAVSLPSYNRLTSLHIRTIFLTVLDFRDILSQCSLLETLAIYDDFKGGWPTTPPPPLELPFLLTLLFYDALNISNSLLLIVAPRLHHLTIARFYPHDFGQLHERITSSSSSSFGLDRFDAVKALTLSLDYGWGHESMRHGVLLAFRCFPGIEEAAFVGKDYPAPFDILSTVDDHDRPAWPNLHTLAIRSPIDVRKLVAFREGAGCPLRRMYCAGEALPPEQDLAWMKERMEVVERDVWDEVRQEGMYYPYRGFGTEEEAD